jgi:sigma-B regulation protein RsbU (phosphoserine phosphatase)
LPNSDDWEFAATCRPARAVAGDYYDVFDGGAGQIVVALGDVSGKGLGPSLVMAGVRAVIRSRLSDNTSDLAGVMRELNQYLESTTLEEMFVTLFVGMLDRRRGALRFVNAGHPPPVLIAPQICQPTRLTEGGILLGVDPEARYDEEEVGLDPGSLVALYSDGITEASNGNGQRFDEPRLLHILRRANSAPASSILRGLLKSVDRFRETSEQQDDMTLVIVRRGRHDPASG